MGCVFCNVCSLKENANLILHSTNNFVVIKDKSPKQKSHFLIISKTHKEVFHELNRIDWQEVYEILHYLITTYHFKYFNLVQNNGKSQGQEIPHVHFHFMSNEVCST